MPLSCTLDSWQLANQRVLVRCDLNVPLENGRILDDFRLSSSLQTIDCIIRAGGKPIIITHLGRPRGAHDQSLSTHHLVPWFESHGYTIVFAPDLSCARELSRGPANTLVLVENLRFFAGEKARDEAFARELAALGDYFVQDAFGSLHRTDTSMTLLPYLFAPEHRTIGLCVEHELARLAILLDPRRPYVVFMGGGKVADKLPLIEGFVQRADAIVLCPAIVFTFMRAQGKKVGTSLVDEGSIDTCQRIIAQATERGVSLIFPQDFMVRQGSQLITVPADHIPDDAQGIALGQQSIEHCNEIIRQAGSILFNAAMGFADQPETYQSTCELLRAIAQSTADTIIAGGDSVHYAHACGVASTLTHLSTGGGAALAYLAGMKLPGLEVFGD